MKLSEHDDERIIVVGSGPCGAIAAARIIERGGRVTMLDAGLVAPKGMIVRAAGNTVFRRVDRRLLTREVRTVSTTNEIEWQYSHSLGGLSNYWTGSVPRYAPTDFTEGAALDERYVWPITYDDLVPYYEMAERWLVVTAGRPHGNVPANLSRFTQHAPPDWTDLADRAEAKGHFLAPMPMAKGSPWMAAMRGTEFDSYHCILASIIDNPRFELIRGALATSLDYSSSSGRVRSVTYADRQGGGRRTLYGRAVVVAAGAIDSTVLLLRSISADFPDGLGNSHGVVGRYIHDHPREWWVARPDTPMTALAHPLYLSRGDVDSSRPLMATAHTLGLTARADRLRTYVRARSSTFGVQVFGTMIPRPEIGIELPVVPSADVGLSPRISISYDQATIDNLTSSRERLQDVFSDAGSSVSIPGPFHDLTPGSSVHYCGTVRMHTSPQFGAVDGWNRLHDVPNVVVCDSSSFTTGAEKNPTLTAMAIAARAADHLVDDQAGR